MFDFILLFKFGSFYCNILKKAVSLQMPFHVKARWKGLPPSLIPCKVKKITKKYCSHMFITSQNQWKSGFAPAFYVFLPIIRGIRKVIFLKVVFSQRFYILGWMCQTLSFKIPSGLPHKLSPTRNQPARSTYGSYKAVPFPRKLPLTRQPEHLLHCHPQISIMLFPGGEKQNFFWKTVFLLWKPGLDTHSVF